MSDVRPRGLRQPLLGVAALLITVGISLGFCALFAPATLASWVSLPLVSAVPAIMILDLGLHLQWPAVLTKVSRPVRALLFTGIAALASAIVTTLSLLAIGGGVTPPNPFVILFGVQSVPVTLVLVVLFRCWPFTALTKSKGLVGVGTFVLTYVITWVLFRVFFDFGFLKGSPVYVERLDPKGLFSAWQSVAFIVAVAAVLLLFLPFDFWPLSVLIAKRPALSKEPAFGLLSGGLALILTFAFWGILVGLGGMDPVVFLVRVTLALIFGIFIVLTLFQGAGFGGLKQPVKGVAVTAAVIVAAVAVQMLYGWAAHRIDPGISAGPPSYAFELWLATAWMSVTFPLIVVFSDALGFWPLLLERAPRRRRRIRDLSGDRDVRDQQPDESGPGARGASVVSGTVVPRRGPQWSPR